VRRFLPRLSPHINGYDIVINVIIFIISMTQKTLINKIKEFKGFCGNLIKKILTFIVMFLIVLNLPTRIGYSIIFFMLAEE